MKLFAVSGKPILYSKSPDIFNYLFKKENINARYFRLAADTAKEAISLFKEIGLSGMNITAPFKTEIIKYIDEIDDLALQIGSVNTIIKKGNKLIGYNTDYYGITNTLKDIKNKRILVLGAGGAANAVVFSVSEKKASKIIIYNRTKEKAVKLANKFNASICDINNLENELKTCDIIINTLPSGIKIIDDNWINSKHIIFDAIYNNSVYKDIAQKKNINFYDGKVWLLNQAIPAFELFTSKKTELNFDIFNKFTEPKNKLIFIGFMGSGKTAISEKVSNIINYKLFCTDDIISKKEGISINKIFKQKGEKYFRKIEQEILSMLSNMDGKGIISTGGGIVLSEENRKIIAENYTAIWLYANTDAIMQRAKPENRPLLENKFTKEFVSKLMEERKAYYLETCDLLINTNNKTIEEIADKLALSELV